MSAASPSPVAVTATSLVSSLGIDVEAACAAHRAGIARPSVLDTYKVGTLDSATGVTVHAAPAITHGFEGDARLLRLLEVAFRRLVRWADRDWMQGRTGVYASVPHVDRLFSGLDLIPDVAVRAKERERWTQRTEERGGSPDAAAWARHLIEKAARLAGLPQAPVVRGLSMSGHTGVAEALALAHRDLAGGTVDFALVGGVDSWIDGPTLQWLERRGRLKSPTMPVGLPPGEACGWLVLESVTHARTRQAEIAALIGGTVTDREEQTQLSGQVSVGRALVRILNGVAPAAGWPAGAPPWLVVDQNGETYRAHEWGCALSGLVDRFPAFQQPTTWFPVASFGDVGAATGVVQACVTIQAFSRGYAPAGTAVLLASGDSGHRTATPVLAPR